MFYQDDTIQPEDFTTQLQRELNSSEQPCLVPFLKVCCNYERRFFFTNILIEKKQTEKFTFSSIFIDERRAKNRRCTSTTTKCYNGLSVQSSSNGRCTEFVSYSSMIEKKIEF